MNAISPTQSNILAALRAFLLNVLPGTLGQDPAVFSGTIAGTVLSVSALPGIAPAGIRGGIQPNSPLLGAAPGTLIGDQISGTTGGVGTYNVSISQTISNATTMATGVSVITGQQNRVPEPVNPFFVVMTPPRFKRFSTNVDTATDVKFTASIAGTTMTVSAIAMGALGALATVFGPGVASGTKVIKQLTGPPGGTGTYQISSAQTVGSETMSAGSKTMTQDAAAVIQLDFHNNDTTAGDFAQIVSTALRDEYGVNFFAGLAPPLNGVVPLYADDPEQRPFINDQDQWEWRFVVDAHLEVSQVVTVPQQFADSVVATVNSSVQYPP